MFQVVSSGEHYNAPQIVDECSTRYCPEILDEFSRTDDHNPITELECNGSNLLLLFEHHVHYSAFSFAFIAQLCIWRREVRQSNWVGLLHCLQALESSIVGTFNNPSHTDLVLGRESQETVKELRPDPDNEAPPVFAPEPHDPESIRTQSEAERSRALEDIGTVENSSAQWVELLDKILPTIPVVSSLGLGYRFEWQFIRNPPSAPSARYHYCYWPQGDKTGQRSRHCTPKTDPRVLLGDKARRSNLLKGLSRRVRKDQSV